MDKTLNEIAKNQPDFPQLQSKFIYALAATLYVLVTKELPFQPDLENMQL